MKHLGGGLAHKCLNRYEFVTSLRLSSLSPGAYAIFPSVNKRCYINRINNDLEVVHPNSGSSSIWFLVELEFGNVGFWGEGKTGITREKPLGARERTNNKLNPHMASTPGLNPSHIAGRRVLSPLHHPCSPFLLFNTVFDSVSSTKKKADNLEANPGKRTLAFC